MTSIRAALSKGSLTPATAISDITWRVPLAACRTLREIAADAAPCCSTAAAWLMLAMVRVISWMRLTAVAVSAWIFSTWRAISAVAAATR